MRFSLVLILLACGLLSGTANASVTLLGSRIIYPAQAASVDLQFKNNDDIPYVIQTWFDDGDVNSQPGQPSQAPFIVTPPVFRIQPKAGQIARVLFTPRQPLPQDRESLFWFNMLQIPPVTSAPGARQNSMTVMLRNRLKLFYRPAAIGKPVHPLRGIRVRYLFDAQKGGGLLIDNPQPWHLSLTALSLDIAGKTFHSGAETIPPFTEKTFWLRGARQRLQDAGTATVEAINDQGAIIRERYAVPAQQR